MIIRTIRSKRKRKYWKFSLMISIIMASLVPSIQTSLAYDMALSLDNDSYPIYSLLTLTFNNKTNQNIQASLTIFNESTGEWQTNYKLLELVQQDLNLLPSCIPHLVEAVIYDYNTSFVPGCAYILLSASDFYLTGEVFNDTVKYIFSHPSTWWYVENLSLPVLDLAMFGKSDPRYFGYYYGCENTEWFDRYYPEPLKKLNVFFIDFETLDFYYSKTPVGDGSSYNYSFVPGSYDIVNGSIIVNYHIRDGIPATLYIYNGTHWTVNIPFVEVFYDKLAFLNSLYFFQHNNITLKPHVIYSNLTNLEEHLEVRLNSLADKVNVTPIFSPNTTDDDIAAILSLGTRIVVCVSYHPSYSDSLQVSLFYDGLFNNTHVTHLYLTVFCLFQRLWFCDRIHIVHLPIKENTRVSLSLFPILAFFVVAVIVLSSKRPRLKRRTIS